MLVYLHGLNSSSRSQKAQRLRAELAPFQVLAVDYRPHRPAEAVARLERFFTDLGPVAPAVIGSSMGGFYARYLARRFGFSHLFLINPALTPWTFVDAHLGERMTTAGGEEYVVDAALGEELRRYAVTEPYDQVPTTLFLDRGDEVIDYRIAERIFADCGRLFVWDGGDHAFQHLDDAIQVLREHLRSRPSATADGSAGRDRDRARLQPGRGMEETLGQMETAGVGADGRADGTQQEDDEDPRNPVAPPAAPGGDVAA